MTSKDQEIPAVLARPKSHTIVLVAAEDPSHFDRTKSNTTLAPGAVFADFRTIDGILKICPTINLPNGVEDVFLGHDRQPNIIINHHKSVIEVGHNGIQEGEVLMCRCSQNSWVQHENHLVGLVGTDKICAALDQKDVLEKGENGQSCENPGTEVNTWKGIEHIEEGGGVLIGIGLGKWKEIAESMRKDTGMEREDGT